MPLSDRSDESDKSDRSDAAICCGASWASDSSDLSDLSDLSEKGTPCQRKATTGKASFPLNLSSTSAVSKVFSRFVGKLKIWSKQS